jgi:glycosyltransferase involved in cell wall biosynthesis
MRKILWITWEVQRRNRELSKAIGAKLYEFSELHSRSGMKKYIKYIIGPVKTITAVIRDRPSIVICQNPSIVLAFTMVITKIITGLPVIVDAHYGGIIPRSGRYRILTYIANFIQKHATGVIVTNKGHKRYVEDNGGCGFILQDKIPNIGKYKPILLEGKQNILVVCSFGNDEPYEEIFDSCVRLQNNTKVYITGDYTKKNIDPGTVPENAVLTGFVDDDRFIALLNSVDTIMVLTTHENCLVCGAYEAVAVEKPMILSDTKALREYFYKGAVYADNTAQGIAKAIKEVIENKEKLEKEVKELKEELNEKWEISKQQLLKEIGNEIDSSKPHQQPTEVPSN